MSNIFKKAKELGIDGEEVVVKSDQTHTVATYFWTEGDNTHFKTVQNVEPILKENYQERKHSNENWNAQGDFKKIASVPLVLWLEWERLGITDDPEALKAALRQHQEVLVTNKSF